MFLILQVLQKTPFVRRATVTVNIVEHSIWQCARDLNFSGSKLKKEFNSHAIRPEINLYLNNGFNLKKLMKIR